MAISETENVTDMAGTPKEAPSFFGGRFGGSTPIEDAEYVQAHSNMSPEAQEALDQYTTLIDTWRKGGKQFQRAGENSNAQGIIGDATEVEKTHERRLELMGILSKEAILDHDKLRPYHAYIIADRAALAKPDLAEEAYERFQERRDNLRDSLGLETLRISASEYRDLTKKIQGAMAKEDHIPLHRDFIAIRKEVAQENALHPRFVAEVAVGRGQLFDELLVDLDRGDLRESENESWINESTIRASLFSDAVAERKSAMEGNTTNRIQAYAKMVAVGKQVVHDPLAIKDFAEQQMDAVAQVREAEYKPGQTPDTADVLAAKNKGWRQVGGKDYEIGMAALENKKFSPEMSMAFFESINYGASLAPKDRIDIFGPELSQFATIDTEKGTKKIPSKKGVIKVAKDPVAMFRAANAAFKDQFDAGDARAGLSYAVMEYSAMRIMNDPQAIRNIAKIDLDAAQAIEQFRPENRKALEEAEGGDKFEGKVYDRMKEKDYLSKESKSDIAGIQITEKGEVDLETALKPKSANMVAYADGKGGFVVAASQAGYEAGDTLSIKGPLVDDNGDSLDFGDNLQKGQKVPMYVQFQDDGKVLIAPSKESIEANDFMVLDDKFNRPGQPEQPHVDAARTEGGQPRASGLEHAKPLALGDGTQTPKTASNLPGFVAPQDDARGQDNEAQAKPAQEGESLRGLLEREGPYIHVNTGGHVTIAATQADFEDGRGVDFSLYGIKVPPPGKDVATKDDAYDAGMQSKLHLEALFQRYGTRGMKLSAIDGRDGQKELMMRLATGEDASYRMLRDGYALPSECDTMRSRREQAATLADKSDRGLWANGFPEDDGSWRSDSLMPHLTRRDKRENLKKTVANSMAGSAMKAQRIFSDRAAELFALDLGTKWEHPSFYREAWEAAQSNPDRMMKLYRNNLKLMKELRGRKDDLTEEEKVSHDRLTIGSRLMGRALVGVGERIDPKTGKKTWKYISPMDVIKDTDPLLSKRGIAIPQSIKDTFNKSADVAGIVAKEGMDKGRQFADYILGTARDLTH